MDPMFSYVTMTDIYQIVGLLLYAATFVALTIYILSWGALNILGMLDRLPQWYKAKCYRYFKQVLVAHAVLALYYVGPFGGNWDPDYAKYAPTTPLDDYLALPYDINDLEADEFCLYV